MSIRQSCARSLVRAVLAHALFILSACTSEVATDALTDSQALHGRATHPFFSTVSIEDIDSVSLPSDGDIWVSCWSDDDAVYTANGDGKGFHTEHGDVVVSRVDGRPNDPADPLRGSTLTRSEMVGPNWIGRGLFYNRKPTGMLCVNGELYLALQDLTTYTFSDAPQATIVRSVDKGRSFSWDNTMPMFTGHVFTTIMFLDYGKDSEHAPDSYAYAYGLDDNWSSVYSARPPQTKLYLARFPNTRVQDRSAWEFFTGMSEDGTPRWDANIAKRAAVLEDTTRRYARPLDPLLERQNMTLMSQGGVFYNAALGRYIYTTWTMYTYELYEAPAPWGPWKHFFTKDFGVFPWSDEVAGGYGTSIPTKFISDDGQTMWMHSNVWEAGVTHYQYSLRRVQLTPYRASDPENQPSTSSLASSERGAVPFVRVARAGHSEFMNDAVLTNQSELSWNGERKAEDYWGYTWPRSLNVNRVRYTTGERGQRGGWFRDLTVQVRRGDEWVAATGVQISPAYSFDSSVLGYQTFTLSFDATATDGVRIFGAPGGLDAFTNIAELSVHFE